MTTMITRLATATSTPQVELTERIEKVIALAARAFRADPRYATEIAHAAWVAQEKHTVRSS